MNLEAIVQEVLSIRLTPIKDGSGHAKGEGTKDGWITGLSMTRIYSPANYQLDYYAAISEAVDELRPNNGELVQVMVNKLEAGHALLTHRDGPPDHNRYHLPVITNDHVTWWDEDSGTVHMKAGEWYGPVSYCGKLHSMMNKGMHARIHIVADFEKE